jgi:cell division protein FtsZ
VNITSGEDLTLNETSEAMAYIQSLCDEDEVNIYFGTVVDPNLEGQVRITVLATGFNPYSPEGRKASEATYATPVETTPTPPADVASPTPATSAPAPLPKIETRRPFVFPPVNIANEKAASRSGQQDTAEVYDESDLDIPAFIREHRKRQQQG